MIRILTLVVLASASIASARDGRPNILFIYVEDLGYYTSERAAREPQSQIAGLVTPNLDRLAARSVCFNRAFCGQSICSPSKGVIYSGLMAHSNGIWRNVFNRDRKKRDPSQWMPLPNPLTPQNDPSNLAVGGLHEDLPTLVERLEGRGVYRALSGKLHVQPARKFPYDVFVGLRDLETVVQNSGDRPWFFWVNPSETHAPFWRSIAHKLPKPNARNAAPNDVDPDAIQMLPWLPDTQAARIDLAQYYSNVRVIDNFVGVMLDKLEASGEAKQTIVVFTGDHGIPIQRGKTSVYPAGTHVPCFISGPGIEGGRVLDTPISQCDFNPTFLEAYGVKPAEVCHGRTLWPILRGEIDEFADRKTILTETNNSFMSQPSRGNETASRAVCDGRYYYVLNVVQKKEQGPVEKSIAVGTGYGEYGDPGAQYAIDLHDETVRHRDDFPVAYELLRQLCMGDAPREELYDLESDPWAVSNLIDNADHQATLTRMREEMTWWRKRTDDRDIHPKLIPRRTGKPIAAVN